MFTGPVGSVAIGSISDSKLPKYSNNRVQLLNRSKRPWFLSLLVAVKVCSSLAVYFLADYLHKEGVGGVRFLVGVGGGWLGGWAPLVQIVAFIQLMSGIIYVVIHKPIWSEKKAHLTGTQWIKIVRHSVFVSVLMLMWVCGLTLVGPFRTVLGASHYDYTLAGILSGLFVAKSGARMRGGVLFVAGLLVLLLFDEGSSFASQESTVRSSITKGSFSTEEEGGGQYITTNSKGTLVLALFLMGKLTMDFLSKTLAADVGGVRRVHSLSTLISGVILFLLVLVNMFSGGLTITVWSWSNFIVLVFIVVFGHVLNYYADLICTKRMETWQVARIGTSASLFSSFIYGLLWVSLDQVPGIPALIAFFLIYFGVWSLTTSERASGGGTLVGFSNEGLPLFNFSSHFSGDARVPLWKNILRLLLSFYEQVQDDRMSRRIFYYLVLTVCFTSVEFLYGAITNSLGLISDGFHMLFDAMAIFIGLCASVMTRWKPNSSFPFGYGRIEVLSGFLNAFFLLVAATVILMEACSRLLSPPSVDAHQTLAISVIGLMINLVGIYVFRNATLDQVHVHDNANIRGVFLHVLADTMGSIGVILSSLMIKHFGLLIADPICSLLIASLILTTAWPLLRDTGRILLLSIPPGLEKGLQQAVLQILSGEGVKGYKMLRFWTHAPHLLTGSIHIQATKDGNDQQIIRHVNNLFSSLGFNHFTTQVEKDEFVSRRNLVDDEDLSSLTSKSITGMQIVGIGSQDIAAVETPE